ncbi:hypothetical protein MTO96_029867 [Rhipicephalus appendiculatus]
MACPDSVRPVNYDHEDAIGNGEVCVDTRLPDSVRDVDSGRVRLDADVIGASEVREARARETATLEGLSSVSVTARKIESFTDASGAATAPARAKLQKCNPRKSSFRGRSAVHPQLEDTLTDFVREVRARSLPVTIDTIHNKAVELAREAGLTREEFRAPNSWVRRFMKRKGFSLRRRTSICQKLPEEFEDQLLNFQRFVNRLREQKNYMMGQIGNADETPVWFDMPSSTTITQRGAKDVKLLPTGNEHSRFTVMLACTADGRKLPPFVIFKRKTMPKEAFPPGVVLHVNQKGYMDEGHDARMDTSSLEPDPKLDIDRIKHKMAVV